MDSILCLPLTIAKPGAPGTRSYQLAVYFVYFASNLSPVLVGSLQKGHLHMNGICTYSSSSQEQTLCLLVLLGALA